MCGRFGASYRDIKSVWNVHGDFSFQKRYNIAPSQEVPVIIRNEGRNEAKLIQGLRFFSSSLVSLLSHACRLTAHASANHSVRSRQHFLRNHHSDLLRRFQVDDELELRRLLNRKIGWFGATLRILSTSAASRRYLSRESNAYDMTHQL